MTIIKNMRLKGFKSFAKPIDLEFGNHFNVVLGANGSGKSNLMDAMCFVLGKISAKSMRAEKSANLIFNGGKNGSPMKEAEVSIIFANENKEFPIDTDQVTVTRIVKKNGQSVYKINDQQMTRQQVVDVLRSAKIDPDGHNVVLQGDIVHFTTMKTEERRQVIEEIAGISVYEEKKAKALRELEKVETKVSEASIILHERETYLRELKKDRDQALKYKELEKNIKSNKATYLHMQLKQKQEKRDEVESKVKKYQQQLQKHEGIIQELKDVIAKKKEVITDINKTIEEKGEVESVNIQKEIETLRTNNVRSQERLNNIKNELERVEARKKQLRITLEDNQKTVKELEASRKELEQTIKRNEDNFKKIEQQIKDFKAQHGLEDLSSLDRLEKEIDKKNSALQRLHEEHNKLLQKKYHLEAKIKNLDEKIKTVSATEKQYNLKKVKQDFEKANTSLKRAIIEQEGLRSQLAKTKVQLQTQTEELFRMQALEAGMKRSLMDDRAIKAILELKNPGIYGTVGELGRVDKEYSLALDVAAGGRLRNIVVKDDKIAADCIKILRDKRLGTATFLPLNKIKPRQGPTLSGKGVIGPALKLVQYDAKFKNIFSFVFGSSIVVENIEIARRLGVGRARMVTLDGDLVELSGAMVGGYRARRPSYGFKHKEVEGGLADIEKQVKHLEKVKVDLSKRIFQNDDLITQLREQKGMLEGELIKIEQSVGDMDLETLEEEKAKLLEDPLFEELQKLDMDIATYNKDVILLKTEKDKFRKNINDSRNPDLTNTLDKLESNRQRVRETIVQTQTEIKNIDTQITNIYMPEHEKTLQILKQHEKELEDFKEEYAALERSFDEGSHVLKTKEKTEIKFQKEFKGLFDKRNKLQEEIQKKENNIVQEDLKIKDVNERVNNANITRAKIVAEYEGLEKEYDEFKGEKLRRGINFEQLKDEIKKFEIMMNQLGNINLRALEVYEEVHEEYAKLLEKKEKLVAEKEDVLTMMEEINSKKTSVFLKTFNILAKNFKAIFGSLSLKGEAFLDLENKEEPLEGGVEIKVKLLGNRLLDIKSLSGGEKTLAALALIFAIQEHQPASFYLLDEIDAALDKRNSELLGELINKYSGQAQYIMISHNDNIITSADRIYGVSMKETGISKIVSLRV